MNKIFTLPIIFVLSISVLSAQILFEEGFEGGVIPPGWIIESNASDGGWKVGSTATISSQGFTIPDNGSAYIAGTNDDDCNCDKSNEYLITPPIDLTGQVAVVLRFDAYYEDNTYQNDDEDATIEVSTDGVNWDVVEDLHGHGSWDQHSVDLSPYAGEETLYIGFRYDDGGGWLYGWGIDNVIVEIPPGLDAALAEVSSRIYGEVDSPLPIEGTFFNGGIESITSIEITYTVDNGTPVSETISGINVPAFSFHHFEIATPWVPNVPGLYTIDVEITSVNGATDEDPDNNFGTFEPEIFDLVTVPNKIEELLNSVEPVITEIAGAAPYLDNPTDLDFFPILGKDELWVINQRTENEGGSTLTIAEATNGQSNFWHRVDGNAWHFMSLPTGIAFSPENFNFASSPGVKDANHSNGTFTGPTLWSSHPDIYAEPSGGNGSHLDMLHASPFSMGIAHEVDNVFWVYDDWNNDIVRYDFAEDHGPGNDDHSDGIVQRYEDIGIETDGDIPNHLILDKPTGWLYFVDNGNDRVLRLDINSATSSTPLALVNEPLAEHSSMLNFTVEVVVDAGLDQPCGIELFDNWLLVGDYANGDIIVFDMNDNFAEAGRIPTFNPGLTGIKVGPDGNIWCTNRIGNTLFSVEPGEPVAVKQTEKAPFIRLMPNPTSGLLLVQNFELEQREKIQVRLKNASGQSLLTWENVPADRQFDLSGLPEGIYFIHFNSASFSVTKKIILL